MVEVKGRASMVWYWSGVGAVVSLFGLWSLDWVDELGKLWEIIAVSLMITGVIVVGMGIWKALDKRPVLITDAEGLLDRTSIPSRRIAWNDIKGFGLVPSQGQTPRFLAVQLADPAAFRAKAPRTLAPILETFEEKFGTPCVISLRAMDVEPRSLLQNLNEAMARRKRPGRY